GDLTTPDASQVRRHVPRSSGSCGTSRFAHVSSRTACQGAHFEQGRALVPIVQNVVHQPPLMSAGQGKCGPIQVKKFHTCSALSLRMSAVYDGPTFPAAARTAAVAGGPLSLAGGPVLIVRPSLCKVRRCRNDAPTTAANRRIGSGTTIP